MPKELCQHLFDVLNCQFVAKKFHNPQLASTCDRRGAIAFALSIRNTLTYSRQMILTTTLIIVVVTVLFCGGSVVTLLTWLRIPCGVDDDENIPISSPSNR